MKFRNKHQNGTLNRLSEDFILNSPKMLMKLTREVEFPRLPLFRWISLLWPTYIHKQLWASWTNLGECQRMMGWVLLLWEGVVTKGQAFQPREVRIFLEDSDSIRAQKKPPWTYLTTLYQAIIDSGFIRDNPLGSPFLCMWCTVRWLTGV